MEEIALTLARGLTMLVIPISLVATVLAIILIGSNVSRVRLPGSLRRPASSLGGESESNQADSSALERVSVALCAILALAGAIAMVTNEIRRNPVPHPLFFVFFGLVTLLSAPALMWRSRWRLPAEGVATVAFSAVAVLTRLSIGFALLPLLVAMIWVCFRHLSAHTNQPLSNHGSSG